MREGRSVGIIIILIAFLITIGGWVIQSCRLASTKQEYNMREAHRAAYNESNYNIIGELYAVTPEGVDVLRDTKGNMWEVPGLYNITRKDNLILEVENNELSKVMIIVWTKENQY